MKPVAVISGGTRGIGYAVAERLKVSHDVVVIGKNPETLRQAHDTLGARTLQLDLANVDAVEEAVAGLGLERVDVLVHSAGVLFTGGLSQTTNKAFNAGLPIHVAAVAAPTPGPVETIGRARGRA